MHKHWLRVILTFALMFSVVFLILPIETAFAEGVELGTLSPGDIVVDRTSVWDFKAGDNYSGEAFKTEAVEWIVVKQDHFGTGTTLLLAKELVAKLEFNSTRDPDWVTSDLRAWLRGEFYNHFSQDFQDAIVPVTTVWGGANVSDETIFVFSDREMGNTGQYATDDGTDTGYFTTNPSRVVEFQGAAAVYWLRSEDTSGRTHTVHTTGEFYTAVQDSNTPAVRPAVNLSSDTLLVEDEGVYVIFIPVPASGVSLDQINLSLIAGGDTATLEATVEPTDATNQELVWSSSDETVATVSANSAAVVTPVGAGTAVITVTTVDGGHTAECTVTVAAATVEEEEPTLPKTGGALFYWLLAGLILALAGVFFLSRPVQSDSV